MPKDDTKNVQLEDILSYTPDSEFTDEELALVRSHFNGVQGNKLLKIIRKVMLPTITDPSLPIEKAGSDAFMTGINFKEIPVEQVKGIVMGRQEAIKFVVGGLMFLKNIANIKDETPEERAGRLSKNSAQ